MDARKIVIIGAGPAGLTAAHELQAAGERDVTILEADALVGGISRTVNHHGNRIDIGGHRFFSKSDWVMEWWQRILPIEGGAATAAITLQYRGQTRESLPSVETERAHADEVMLVRSRLSRIYFNRQFFDYPLKLNLATLQKLGLLKTVTFGLSYLWAHANPILPERSFEDFLINRFGRRLYRQFFKEYTEKVWGVPCSEISAEWGAQRIKSLSVLTAIVHALKSALGMQPDTGGQTSLIESFIYPKFGPGQMWETVARSFVDAGGRLCMQHKVGGLTLRHGRVVAVRATDDQGQSVEFPCTHLVSTMPIRDLVAASPHAWTPEVRDIASRLEYRDFITVGLLYRSEDLPRPLADNWIYIQEPGVQVGRVQVFNNWSPHMVADPATVWLGLEFFCRESDPLWTMSDQQLVALGEAELAQIGLVSAKGARDAVVIRVPKAYPGYFGSGYQQFGQLREALDRIENLFPIGRNGMHRYNNQDHSMLTAKEAVDQIVSGTVDKATLWAINVGDDYHEQK